MYQIHVSARTLRFPNVCCCCGCVGADGEFRAIATRTTGQRVVKTDTRWWNFPICGKCLTWMALQKSAQSYFKAFGVSLVLGIGSLFFGLVPIGVVAIAVSPFMLLGWSIKKARAGAVKPAAGCVLVPVVYDHWNGSVHTFRLANSTFCQAFANANATKLRG